jgi:hypothetical protein
VDALTITGTDLSDTQLYTKTNVVSFAPGTTDGNNRYVFTMIEPTALEYGHFITLNNVLTGPASATGQVFTMDHDEVTLEFSSAKTFVDTSSLTNLTGTFNSSGTTLTGTGSLLLTEVIGRVYVKADGEYRQILKVVSDTSANLSSAFTLPLSGDTAQIVRCNLVGVPSQQHGLYMAQNMTKVVFSPGGNTVSAVVPFVKWYTTLNGMVESIAPGQEMVLYSTGTFDAATFTNLYASVPSITNGYGYEIVGYRFQILTDVTDTSGSTIGLALVGGSTQAFETGLAVVKNTKATGNVVPERLGADTQLRATFSGGADNTPSGGTYQVELRVRRAGFKPFTDV